jgi:hypothetical protein
MKKSLHGKTRTPSGSIRSSLQASKLTPSIKKINDTCKNTSRRSSMDASRCPLQSSTSLRRLRACQTRLLHPSNPASRDLRAEEAALEASLNIQSQAPDIPAISPRVAMTEFVTSINAFVTCTSRLQVT